MDIEYNQDLVTPRTHGQIMNVLFRLAMERHKQQILPRHFQNVPETRPHSAYGYLPRSRMWQERKVREGRGNLPNVYTGGLRTSVLRDSVVTATQHGSTLTAKNHDANAPAGSRVINGKRYANKVRFPLTDQRRREIEMISQRELGRMAGRIKMDYVRLANHPDFRRRRAPKRIAATT